MPGDRFTHLDDQGRAQMVDVTDKAETQREATARARIRMKPQTLAMIRDQRHPKGDVIATARIAGIQAAKKTWDLIPMCHPLLLSQMTVAIEEALTVYDMCKAVDRGMVIEEICLLEKEGGRSGHYVRTE